MWGGYKMSVFMYVWEVSRGQAGSAMAGSINGHMED